MTGFTVNHDTCISCGACVEDCPTHVLGMSGEYPIMQKEEFCMRCQHCLAVCPTASVSILGRDPEDSTPLKGNLPEARQLETLIKGRRSIRQFEQKDIDPALLKELLHVAGHAPTGTNTLKLHVSALDTLDSMNAFREEVYARLHTMVEEGSMPENPRKERLTAAARLWKAKRLDTIFLTAPHCLFLSNAKNASCVDEDAIIFLSTFELVAQTRGVGTVWCGLLNRCLKYVLPDLLPRLGITENESFVYPMLFGYPGVEYYRTVERGMPAVTSVRWG